MPIQKSKRQAQKSEKHLAFPDALAPVTRKLSFAEITGNLSKRRSQISKRRQSFSASSAPVTRKLSFAEITGNLSKRRSQISKRCQSFFSLVKHLSYAHSTLRKSQAICRRFSQGRHTEPFFISKNAFPTKPLGSLSVPYSLGYLCKPMTPKQKYLISPG
ncbi:hypothetical protein ACFX12_032102 [Malus domestica]